MVVESTTNEAVGESAILALFDRIEDDDEDGQIRRRAGAQIVARALRLMTDRAIKGS